jgi:hypothetical protein
MHIGQYPMELHLLDKMFLEQNIKIKLVLPRSDKDRDRGMKRESGNTGSF